MYNSRSPEMKHPAAPLSGAQYKDQNRMVSTLPWPEIDTWLHREVTVPARYRKLSPSSGGGIEVLASSVQMKLAQRKENSILYCLAQHEHLTGAAFTYLLQLKKNNLTQLLAKRENLSSEQVKQLLAVDLNYYQARCLVLNPSLNAAQLEEALNLFESKFDFKDNLLLARGVLNRQEPMSFELFQRLKDRYYENLTSIDFCDSSALPALSVQQYLEEGDIENLRTLADRMNNAPEVVDQLIKAQDDEVLMSVAFCTQSFEDRHVRFFLSAEGYELALKDLSSFVGKTRKQMNEADVLYVIKRMDQARTDPGDMSSTLHSLVWVLSQASLMTSLTEAKDFEPLPKDFVLAMNQGNYGSQGASLSLGRPELPVHMLERTIDELNEVNPVDLIYLATNPHLGLEIQRKLSYFEDVAMQLSVNPSLRVDDSFAWSYFIKASHYTGSNPSWRIHSYPGSEMFADAINEIGEEFANIWLNWDGSLKDVLESYRKLKNT